MRTCLFSCATALLLACGPVAVSPAPSDATDAGADGSSADATPDTQPDTTPDTVTSDCPAGADAVPYPQCSGSEPAYFPTFSKACSTDGGCVVGQHQINCCGTKLAWGLAAAEQCSFGAAEAVCQDQYPGCGCAQFMTQAEDGYTSFTSGDFAARCTAGVCRSYVKGAAPVCTQDGLQAPKPVKTCTVDSDCDFSSMTVDCCGSAVFTGIAKFAKAAYDVEQKKCTETTAICKCMPKPTVLDDGKPLTTSSVKVSCMNGTCWTGSVL